MQKSIIVLASALVMAPGAEASALSAPVWINSSLPFVLALAAVLTLVTVSAKPVTLSVMQLHRMPMTSLPRISFFLTKLSLLVLMSMVLLGQF